MLLPPAYLLQLPCPHLHGPCKASSLLPDASRRSLPSITASPAPPSCTSTPSAFHTASVSLPAEAFLHAAGQPSLFCPHSNPSLPATLFCQPITTATTSPSLCKSKLPQPFTSVHRFPPLSLPDSLPCPAVAPRSSRRPVSSQSSSVLPSSTRDQFPSLPALPPAAVATAHDLASIVVLLI